MSCKTKSPSKSIKFQPMPMAALIANLKTLPATLNRRDSSDSSDESNSSFDKLTAYSKNLQRFKSNLDHNRAPLAENHSALKHVPDRNKTPGGVFEGRITNRELYRFPKVDVMPPIEASATTSTTLPAEKLHSAQKGPPVVEKKESARCLFPEAPPAKEPPTPKQPPTLKEPPTPKELPTPKEPPTPKNLPTPREAPTPKETPTSKDRPATRALPCPPNGPQMTSESQSHSTQLRTPSIAATPSQPQGSKNAAKIQFKTMNIKGKKYMFLKKLGTGGSSEVFKVLEVSSSNEFAVKCVDLAIDREMAQGYMNEVKLLRDLQKSDRVIKLYEYEYDRANNFLRLVMEVGETDLACFLRAHRDGAPPALVLHYWEEMLRAVRQIHEHGIVHADLKPANFLLVSGRLKLIDFGIASAVSSDATSVVRSCGKGTFSYISPEALGGDGSHPLKVSFYSDVWSLGCILYSLVYGHTPFAHLANIVKLVTIRDPHHVIAYPPVDNIPPTLLTALQSCLRYDAHSRPTVAELLQIRHLELSTRRLPKSLLEKIHPHVTPQEYEMLQNARVKED